MTKPTRNKTAALETLIGLDEAQYNELVTECRRSGWYCFKCGVYTFNFTLVYGFIENFH